MSTYPKGFIGEVVGFNGGYTHSLTKRAVICGVTKHTVSIMVGDQRVVFNRNTWTERGSKRSRFASYLVSEAALLRDQARYQSIETERKMRGSILQVLKEMSTDLTFAQPAEDYAELSVRLTALAEQAREAAYELHKLETACKEARQAVAA